LAFAPVFARAFSFDLQDILSDPSTRGILKLNTEVPSQLPS
jgi:hypothetical protein